MGHGGITEPVKAIYELRPLISSAMLGTKEGRWLNQPISKIVGAFSPTHLKNSQIVNHFKVRDKRYLKPPPSYKSVIGLQPFKSEMVGKPYAYSLVYVLAEEILTRKKQAMFSSSSSIIRRRAFTVKGQRTQVPA